MSALLEWKQKLHAFCSKNEAYLALVWKFCIAAASFWLIDAKMGYLKQLSGMPLLLAALVCALLPQAAILFVAAVLVVLHCMALSLAAGAAALILFLVMYLLYFRFAPQYGYNVLLVPIAYIIGIPYAVPAANGLLQKPQSAIPTICGTVTYYFLKGIVANEDSLSAKGGVKELLGQFQEVVDQFIGNSEMYLSCAVFVFTTLLVFAIRSLSVDYAWTIAIVIGMMSQFLAFFMGYMELGLEDQDIQLVFGCLVSTVVLAIIQFFAFHLDYARTEYVQFEDDEYYYYVKAVPKQYVPAPKTDSKELSAENKKKRK